LKQLTTRKKQAVALALLTAAGFGAPLLTSSAAQAETGVVANYSFTTNPAGNLVDGQVSNLTVANTGNPSALASIEIHLCNTGAIDNQFDYSYDSGLCSPEPPGHFSANIDPFGSYGVPPGETSSDFTYTVASGTTPDGIVTCGQGASNCYLVYRVTNAAGDEFYFGQNLTWAPPATTTTSTSTTIPTTTSTSTTTTIPTTTSTSTTSTIPTTTSTSTTTTIPTTTSTSTTTTIPTTTSTSTTTTIPTTTSTSTTSTSTTSTTKPTTTSTSTTSTTKPTTTSTTKATTTSTTKATTTSTRATTTTKKSTTTSTKPTTTTKTTRPTTTTNPICQYKSQIPAWLLTLIQQIFGVTCP
jgi:hypothetical protein